MESRLVFKASTVKFALICNARKIVEEMLGMKKGEVRYVEFDNGKISFSDVLGEKAVGIIESLDLTDFDGVSRCNRCGLLKSGWLENPHRCHDESQEKKLKELLIDAIVEEMRMGGFGCMGSAVEEVKSTKVLMHKKIALGRFYSDYYNYKISQLVEVEIELRDRDGEGKVELSIVGWFWNNKHTKKVIYGQICDTLKDCIQHGKYRQLNYPWETIAKLLEVWDRWHLNSLRAGCEHQRKLGWDSLPHEETIGKACPVCGYKYGSAWLHEPLPEGVIDFIKSL